MSFDYSKLNGRIVEKFETRVKFSEKLGISGSLLSRKLSGETPFKQNEIQKSCELLDISPEMIPEYFFKPKVQYIEQ